MPIKLDRVATGLYWFCNALTFAISAALTLWFSYSLFSMFHLDKFPREESFSIVISLTLIYFGFITWKTGKWLLHQKPGTALHFLWYWLGAMIVFGIWLFMTAAWWMGSRSPR